MCFLKYCFVLTLTWWWVFLFAGYIDILTSLGVFYLMNLSFQVLNFLFWIRWGLQEHIFRIKYNYLVEIKCRLLECTPNKGKNIMV